MDFSDPLYFNCVPHTQKMCGRNLNQKISKINLWQEDDILEKEIIDEFERNNELDLLDYPDDDNKPYKMFLGKRDIIYIGDDSSKFSNKLVTLV